MTHEVTTEQQMRDNLALLKGIIDTTLIDQEELPVINGIILAGHTNYGAGLELDRSDSSQYSVRFHSDIAVAAEGESTQGSWLAFDGDALTVTEAEINVARKDPEGEQSGFNRRVSASRLPGFVASITMQVIRETDTERADMSGDPEETLEDVDL